MSIAAEAKVKELDKRVNELEKMLAALKERFDRFIYSDNKPAPKKPSTWPRQTEI